MRIGIFTDTYTPYINGVTTSVLMLKKGLEKAGHKVYVVTVNPEKLHYAEDKEENVLRIPGIPTGIYDYRLTGFYPIRALLKIKKWNLDIIHTQTEFGIGTFARIVSKQLKIPLVHTYHTMYEDYIHYITHGYFQKTGRKICEYITLFYCDKTIQELIVPTKKARELFKEKYQVDRKVYVVPTGIDIDRFKKENNKNIDITEERKKLNINELDFVISFVGRIALEKNIDFLIKAMPKILCKKNNVKLLIIGAGPDLENYKKLCKKLKIDNSVIFTGKVPWSEIPKYYLLSDVLATASKSETQGLTVLEGMAAELPIICINDESFLNVVKDDYNGLVFSNETEYIKEVLSLSSNIKKITELKHNAFITAKKYSVEAFATGVLDVYKIAIENYGKKGKKKK